MPKIYIDGQVGTTGLEIYSRLKNRKDLEILKIDNKDRKNKEIRKKLMNQADLVFLCLPDDAAREAVTFIENNHTKVIDASSAHRTSWTYGFSELGFTSDIANSFRVANPGCHASGCISILYPLIKSGYLSDSGEYVFYSLTGYSGGGKKMIEDYTSHKTVLMEAPRMYGLSQSHKHLPEIAKVCGLQKDVILNPVVCDYYRGMSVNLSLYKDIDEVYDVLSQWYSTSSLIQVVKQDEGMISANTKAGSDSMMLIVSGNHERCVVTSLFDNLGKGACGAAIQNMNIMLGLNEMEGLR